MLQFRLTPSVGVCPDGLQPLNDPRTLLPTPCRANQHDACPATFHCLYHPFRRRHFCCGPGKQAEVCPNGTRMIRLGSGDPMGCNIQAQCPEGAHCHLSGSTYSGICCKNLLSICPPGFVLDRDTQSECSPLERHSCSLPGSLCLYTEILQRFICCKKEHPLLAAQRKFSVTPNCFQSRHGHM
ncbi:unnamed protein product [Strongylus vulgaris]|uniref:EB domain-containing protein n=1 Tax=Strongylus vulgaris TaxID=40348 RepID=A0A3P7IRQ6_STRVU|nr:unnamed protein product [Strongylus vulgaris]